MMKRSVQKEAYWRELIGRQASSGLSVRRFCAGERISEASFYAWRRKVALRDGERVGAQARPGGNGDGSPAGEFVSLRLIDSDGAGTLEVVHPAGCQVRITGTVDSVALERVLAVLDARGAR